MNITTNGPATQDQIERATFLGRLAASRADTIEREAVVNTWRGSWSTALASHDVMESLINNMMTHVDTWKVENEDNPNAQERAHVEARQAERRRKRTAPEGMHKLDGDIYKVQKAVHGSGHNYAKALVEDGNGGWTFDYARGAILRLSEDTLMSLEEAKEFGVLYGTCVYCGRTLTNEASIAEGLGPICAKKF